MNTALVLARFMGADGSLGYRKGKMYALIVTRFDWFSRLMKGRSLEIIGVDGKGWCPYSSEEALLRNWLIVPEGKYRVKIEKITRKKK